MGAFDGMIVSLALAGYLVHLGALHGMEPDCPVIVVYVSRCRHGRLLPFPWNAQASHCADFEAP